MLTEEECHRTVERAGYFVICPMLPELRQQSIASPARTDEYSSSEVTLDRGALEAMLAPYRAGQRVTT